MKFSKDSLDAFRNNGLSKAEATQLLQILEKDDGRPRPPEVQEVVSKFHKKMLKFWETTQM